MDYTPYYIGGGIIAVAIVGAVGYIVFRKRKKATPIPKTTEKLKTEKSRPPFPFFGFGLKCMYEKNLMQSQDKSCFNLKTAKCVMCYVLTTNN